MKSISLSVLVLALVSQMASAQKWEVGGVGGGSFYTSRDVTRTNSTSQASFAPGFAAGVQLGQEMGRLWGGEIRYTYLNNEAQLKGGGTTVRFGGQSHAVHYDFLLHFSPAGSKVRPYISFGAGIKHYRGTGSETVTQPLSEFALLTRSTDTTPLATFGVGVKFRVNEKASLRVEFKDYISPIPTKVITPNRGSDLSGWIHNFVPMIGIAYIF